MAVDLAPCRAPEALPDHPGPSGRGSSPARNWFARRYGRHVSAGLQPDAGVYARLPAWWSRQHWVDYSVPIALGMHRDWAREEHVHPDTVKRVARALAASADHSTGRRCRPTNERLAAVLGMSARQIQRARRLLKRLGLVVEVVRGRMFMTRAERLAAWRRGSSHRKIAAEFALVSPRYPQSPAESVEHVTPPLNPEGERVSNRKLRVLRCKRPRDEGDFVAQPKSEGSNSRHALDRERSRRLIAGVQQRVPWLRGVSPARLTPLHRFARERWTPRDVHRALDEVLRARGWSVPDTIEHPAAYLAALLREVDPADRPGALEEAMHAEELLRREWLWQTRHGTRECVHGTLAGDLPHPVDGHLACPMCRRAGR